MHMVPTRNRFARTGLHVPSLLAARVSKQEEVTVFSRQFCRAEWWRQDLTGRAQARRRRRTTGGRLRSILPTPSIPPCHTLALRFRPECDGFACGLDAEGVPYPSAPPPALGPRSLTRPVV